MKENICTAAGVIGGFFAALLGGWDSALATLLIFMAIDFTTGLITAYGQKQAQQDWQAEFKGGLGRSYKEVLHSAHGGCGCPYGYSDRHHIYP